MRRSLILASVATIAVVLAWVVFAAGGDPDSTLVGTTGLETRTVSSRDVDVKIEPRQLDAQGAVFAITLDTHSVELSMELTAAEFEVGGIPWPVAGWDGDGPGGHHREGTLRFDAAGPAAGTVRLVLSDFPEPVEVTWEFAG